MKIELEVSAMNAVMAGTLASRMAMAQGWTRTSVMQTVQVGNSRYSVTLFVSQESGMPY
jgi:hypothetical protein